MVCSIFSSRIGRSFNERVSERWLALADNRNLQLIGGFGDLVGVGRGGGGDKGANRWMDDGGGKDDMKHI